MISKAVSVGSPIALIIPSLKSDFLSSIRITALLQSTAVCKRSFPASTPFIFTSLSSILNSPLSVTSISSSERKILFTVILFSVKVPVLSEHITSAQPNVSTA